MKVDLQPSAPPRQTQRPPSLFAAGKQEAGGRALKAKAARIPACPARVQFLFDNKNYTNPAKQNAPPPSIQNKTKKRAQLVKAARVFIFHFISTYLIAARSKTRRHLVAFCRRQNALRTVRPLKQ